MKRTKKLLSFFLAIMMVITTIPAFTLTANAATLSVSSLGLMAGNDSNLQYRVKGDSTSSDYPQYVLCNDGSSGNFTSAFWKYTLPALQSGYAVSSATIGGTINFNNNCNGCKGINFYAVNPSNSYLSNYAQAGNINRNFTQGGTAAVSAVENQFPEKIHLGTFASLNDESSSATSFSITITDGLQSVYGNGWDSLVVVAIPNYNTKHATQNTSWSDVVFYKPTVTYETAALVADDAVKTTNRVTIKDAIYTYSSSSAIYNYGKVISEDNYWYTPITVNSGTVKSIKCLEDNSPLYIKNDKLSGTFTNDNFKVSGKTNVFATLQFTFSDGKTEKHKVAVKSYPIEAHNCIFSWNDGNRESGYTTYLRGSTGSNGTSVFKDYSKYYGSYSPSGTSAYGSDVVNHMITDVDKKAGTGVTQKGDTTNNTPPVGTYYIDKSCRNTSWSNLGNSELWDGTKYTIKLDIIRTRWRFALGDINGTSTQKDDTGATVKQPYTKNDTNGYTNTHTFSKALNIDKATDYNYHFNIQNTRAGSAYIRANIQVNLFDKRTQRDFYIQELNNSPNEGLYTADSYNAYENALIELEAYLSNYEDTSDNSTYANNVTTKKNALVYRASAEQYQQVLAAYNTISKVTANRDLYTTSSYNTFFNEAANDSTLGKAQDKMRILSTSTNGSKNLPFSNYKPYLEIFNTYLGKLKERADFTALASQYSTAAAKLAETDKYTTSTLNALKSVYDNAVYAKYSDTQKADTARVDSQDDIDNEKTAIENAINALVQRADFEYYEARVSDVATALGIITEKDGQYIRVYRLLEPYTRITLYTEDQKANTPISEQTTVNNKGAQIDTLNTNVDNSSVLGTDYVDQTALKAFIDKNFDLDVVDNSNITDQKKSANGLYEKITFNGNEYWSLNVANQAELDSNIASYINSINSTLGKYDIKVPDGISVAVSGQTQTPTSTTDGISTYRLTYGVPITFTSTNADTAWYMEYQSNVAKRGVQYQCSGETYATKVMGNMTITAKSNSDSNTPNKVTVVRQYSDGSSSAMLIDYVNGSYVLPTAQTYPNYVFAGYEVNGTEYNAGATVTITGDTIIYAKYTADGGDHQIIITDTTGTTTDKTYKYNSAVKLNDPNAYAWIEKPIGSDTWRPSYIGTGCSYKVTEPMELMAVKTEAEMKQLCGNKEAYAPNLRYNGPLVANGMGVVFHGQFINYVPEGAQIVEYGVAVNTNNANSFDLINTNGKVIRCKSTNPMKSNQFSVGARYNGDTFTSSTTISYRSYMIYQITVDGQLETRYVYSDVRTFNPNA